LRKQVRCYYKENNWTKKFRRWLWLLSVAVAMLSIGTFLFINRKTNTPQVRELGLKLAHADDGRVSRVN
jgi:hypothetical protein